MDYWTIITKWLEAYVIPNQESSTVAEALVTNFFCHFRVPQELHSDEGREWVRHAPHPAPTIGQHGRMLHQNGQGTPMKSRRITPEGLGLKITHLPPCLQGMNS
jgi:hypothetical protein